MQDQHLAESNSEVEHKTAYMSAREYVCPCGKAYLSYPALFTHVKQKHSGKAPGDIIKPASKTNLKRGRPKGIKNREGGGRLSATDCTKRLGEPNAIDMDFLHYLIRVAKDLKDDPACGHAKFRLYYTFLGCNKVQYKVSKITAQFAFTHFLKELGQKIGQRNTIINGVVVLLGLFLSYVDELYESKENVNNFTANESPEQLGFFANCFMTEYFPKRVEELGLEDIEFFQEGNLVKILEYVFIWLYKKEYVNKYLRVKKEMDEEEMVKEGGE